MSKKAAVGRGESRNVDKEKSDMSTLEELEERVNKLEAALLAQGETLRKLEEFMNGVLDREKEEAERYEREAEDRKAKLGIHMP